MEKISLLHSNKGPDTIWFRLLLGVSGFLLDIFLAGFVEKVYLIMIFSELFYAEPLPLKNQGSRNIIRSIVDGDLSSSISPASPKPSPTLAHMQSISIKRSASALSSRSTMAWSRLYSFNYLKFPPPAFRKAMISTLLLYLNRPPPAFNNAMVSTLLLYLKFPPSYLPQCHGLNSTSLI